MDFQRKMDSELLYLMKLICFGSTDDMKIDCPSCLEEFEIPDEEPEIKKRLTCPHCQQQFEVTWLYPFTLDFIDEYTFSSDQLVGTIID